MATGRLPGTNYVSVVRWSKTLAAGVTVLSGTDDNSVALTYSAGLETVYLNGVLLARGVDYTATDGSTITLTVASVLNDIVNILSTQPTSVTNAVLKTQVTAKGDVLVGSGNALVTNLPVGADGTTLVANSSSSTGVAWAGPAFVAGKNKIINGDFNINQRNFTSVTATDTYGFDRWKTSIGSGGGSGTYTPQTFTPGAAPVAGYEATNYAQLVSASQSAVGDWTGLQQRIEDVRTLAGQTATISFWAKAGSGTPKIGITAEQYFGTGGSSTVVTSPTAQTILSSWVRYSFNVSIPSVSGKTIGAGNNLGIFIFTSTGSTLSGLGYAPVGLQNATIGIWGIQIEAGSIATAFQTATGTLQGELAACQRYYERVTAGNAYEVFAPGWATSTTNVRATYYFKVPKRAAVSSTIDYSALRTTANVSISAVSMDANGINSANINCTTTSVSTNNFYNILADNNTAAYLGFSAEL